MKLLLMLLLLFDIATDETYICLPNLIHRFALLVGLSHCAIQFPCYEFLKRYLREQRYVREQQQQRQRNNNNNNNNVVVDNYINDDTDNTVGELLLSSGLAKMTASLLTYPHEVIRSRMMDARSTKAPTFRGTIHSIYIREGFKGYYQGLSVTLLRVVPNCCVTFLSYEMIFKYSKNWLAN